MRTRCRKMVMLVSVFAILACSSAVVAEPLGAPDSQSVDVPAQTQNGSDASIASELSDASGTVTLFVDFESPPQDANVSELQEYANSSQADFLRFAEQTPTVTVENRFWLTNSVLVTADTSTLSLDSVAEIDGVTRLEVNTEVTTADGRADSSSPRSMSGVETNGIEARSGLHQINASTVWERYDARGDGVRVAVLDTGVDPDHPDIDLDRNGSSGLVSSGGWAEFDSSGNRVENTEPRDTATHGTHVSGIVAGGNASGEYIGVAPEAELMHGLVLPGGDGTTSQVIGGIEWAVANNADVIVMSLGGETYNGLFIDAIENAIASDVAVVAAIGNNGEGTSISPGNVYGVFSVGAVDSSNEVRPSSGGERIVVADSWHPLFAAETDGWPDEYVVPTAVAPGVSVRSTVPGGGYRQATGTSMAAPHVGGAIALLQSATRADLSTAALTHALEQTATKPDDWPEPDDEQDPRYGYGTIDVGEAVERIDTEQLVSEFTTIHSYASPTTVTIGERVKAAAVIENQGNLDGEYTGTFSVDGVRLQSESVVVPSGEAETVSVTLSFTEPGTHNFTIEGRHLGTVTVEPPRLYDVTNTTLANDTVETGEPVVVGANVTNAGEENRTVAPTLVVNSEPVAQQQVDLAPGESTRIQYEQTFSKVGEYSIAVDSKQAGTVTVERREGPAGWYYDYAGTNGIVNKTGLDAAVADYLAGALAENRLNLVIRSHLLGRPIAELE